MDVIPDLSDGKSRRLCLTSRGVRFSVANMSSPRIVGWHVGVFYAGLEPSTLRKAMPDLRSRVIPTVVTRKLRITNIKTLSTIA